MAEKLEQIEKLVREIESLKKEIKEKEVGNVVSITSGGVATVTGLNNVMCGELLTFPQDVSGIVFNLEVSEIGVVLVGDYFKVKEGDEVYRTKEFPTIPVCDEFLGKVVDSFGKDLLTKRKIQSKISSQIEKKAPSVMALKVVSESLDTGNLIINALIPIGKGQKELIIGDRETGKTTLAVDIILNQKEKKVYCIYVGISQKTSVIAQISHALKIYGADSYTTIICSYASDPASLHFFTPYAGMALAEHWRSQGRDVLIVFDDLTKHADAYRTLSLLLRRPPGREAYPGDTFYLHARLLERSARLNKQHGGGSITSLPIVETKLGDISSYISTNIISITDGQIFLSHDNLFNNITSNKESNFYPAISVGGVGSGASVSRVGGSAQCKLLKEMVSSLKLKIFSALRAKRFSQFGADIDKKTRETINYGEKITEILRQEEHKPFSLFCQILLLFAVREEIIKWLPILKINDFKEKVITFSNSEKGISFQKKEIDFNSSLSLNLRKKIFFLLQTFILEIIADINKYKFEDYGTSEEWKRFCTKEKISIT